VIPAPPPVPADESPTVAADRMDKIARDLTVFAEDFEARSRAFRERAQEYLDYAAKLRGAK